MNRLGFDPGFAAEKGMTMQKRVSFALVAGLAVTACSPSETTAPSAAASPGETVASSQPVSGMVAAAHPDAVEAGLEVLRNGGDAVDAAITVQTVLSLVEPQSSGIGGGAFMVRYDAETGQTVVYDGREMAPAAATETLFIGDDGEPLGFIEAWRSGLSTGAPGVIAMLAMAHDDHGQTPWADAFRPAIALAENGFEVAPRLNSISQRMAQFTDIEEIGPTATYLFDETGQAFPVGHVLTNSDYAQTMRAVAEDWRNFYTGDIAEDIVAAVNEAPRPGLLTLEDLANYEPRRVEALCSPYRTYTVCSAPPPSSGGIAIGMILGILERFDLSASGPETVEGWHLFIEASRLAYADRDHYVGDPAFADVPVEGLLDRVYLSERAGLIDPNQAIAEAVHGVPPGAPVQPEDTTDDAPGTSHFVIMDSDGDVVSMTTSVESPFGSGRMAGGFFLNNQLTDFAFEARDDDGRLRPNAVAAGKRPRSSMSPTLVMNEQGGFVLATGSPGGNSIIAYTAKTLVGMLDWGLSPQEAADLPNVVARGDIVRIEEGFDPAILEQLRALGFEIEGGRGEISGIHIIRAEDDGALSGAADRRRDGTVGRP
jgi:gamma-glutamyltranspeptidase/glutathione hydrolase